jgi:hypothetical protein
MTAKTKIYLVALAALLAAFVVVSPLAASTSANLHSTYVHTLPPYQDPVYEKYFTDLMDGKLDASASPTIPGQLQIPGWTAAEMEPVAVDAGRLALISEACTVACPIVASFGLGWEIGRTIDNLWLHLGGNTGSAVAAGTSVTGETLLKESNNTNVNTTFPTVATAVSYTMVSGCISAGVSGIMAYDPALVTGVSGTPLTCLNDIWTAHNAYAGPQTKTTVPNNFCTAAGTGTTNGLFGIANSHYTGPCYVMIWTQVAMDNALIQSAPATFTNQAVDAGPTAMSPAPKGSASSTQLATARSDITGSADPSLPQEVNCLLAPADYVCPSGAGVGDGAVVSPGTLPSTSFVLPQPTPDDTYITYTERLRALGYLGSVNVTDDAMSEYPSATYGARLLPKSLTTIQIGTATLIPLYDQSTGLQVAWPTAPGLVTPGVTTSVALRAVPNGYDPTAHGATPATETGAGATPGGGSGCNCPPLDFSPITSTSFGTHFPFGVLTWFTSFFSGVPSSGTHISFDLTKPSGGTPYHISFANNDWTSTYRPIIWPIIEFGFIFAAAAFLAYRILGMGTDNDAE